ncbi:MAG: GMC family oxidoreductase [Alphaproteobacteria bacterium]
MSDALGFAGDQVMDADYVIVGAGSAGCVVARRLVDSGAKVVLLEAGPPDRHPYIHIPAGMLKLLYHPVLNWNYKSEGEAGTAGREIHWPRGKTLGGSSSINGMLYIRGHAEDYNAWAQAGCRGWSYDDVLPYFRRSESFVSGKGTTRGETGPLQVEDYRTVLPLTHRFVEAAQEAGHPFQEDLNGYERIGVGYSQMSRIGRRRGSTAQTFLAGVKGRETLEVITEALASRLIFEGKKCVGVAYERNGKSEEVRAGKEIILAGGSVNSPHLLQISGIGPAEHLKSIGVEPIHDLPGVGANLSDHYCARVSHRAKDAVSINQLARGMRLAWEGMRFVFEGRGALTFGVSTAQVFTMSREGLASPDIQLLFSPASYDPQKFGALEKKPGMTIACSVARPESRGSIMAQSADPRQAPLIRPNYLSTENDVRVIIEGVRQARKVFEQAAFHANTEGEIVPGPDVQTDGEIAQFAREAGSTIYHPVGVCKMGPTDDPMAVVDPRLKVRGLEGLRVIDASIMPAVTTANTNSTAIMIGEKGATMILEDQLM